MTVGYLISKEAKDDLKRIYHFGYLEFDEQQTDDYFHRFFAAFQKMANNPLHYESVDHIRLGYRRYPYNSDTIYYRLNNTKVEIMAILGGQDLDTWL